MTTPSPRRTGERIVVLDVLRGFALFGVLVVNFSDTLRKPTSPIDQRVEWWIELLLTGSFYPLFATMFGVGFVMQVARWEAQGAPAFRLYLRRLTGLALFGVAIWCFLTTWWTLLQYAAAGLALLPFRRASPRTLLVSAGIVYLLTAVVVPQARDALMTRDRARTEIDAGAAARVTEQRARQATQHANNEQIEVLKRGNAYGALVGARARQLALILGGTWWYTGPGLGPLALFLVGAALARSRILEHPLQHSRALRRVLVWGGVAGLATNLVTLTWLEPGSVAGLGGALLDAVLDLGDTSLAFAYGAAVVLLYGRQDRWSRALAPLAPAGRATLSNVVLQWIVITTVLFGYALGLLDHLGAVTCLLLSGAIFAAELWLSRRWLARLRFGPLEWLWRMLTYWRIQPMRL